MEHRPLDRVPLDYWGTPEMTLKLKKHFGVSTDGELWKKLKIDKIIWTYPEYTGPPLEPDADGFFGFWGVKSRKVCYGSGGEAGEYSEFSHNPLNGYGSIREIEENYTWPKADWFDYSTVWDACAGFPDHAVEGGYMAPFYVLSVLRGLEQSLMDLAGDEEMSRYLLDHICSFLYDFHERFFEAAKGRLDITQVTDDFGTQTGLMISLGMFEKYFKSPYRRFIRLAKDYRIKVFHHDDGAIMELIPELAKLNIDILNPIQWHLPGMSLKGLKDAFGASLCFHGGIDNQEVLPFGGVRDVENEVRACIEVLARDKTGYILAPCHNIQVITPVDNVLAMYDTARNARF